jgi:hypothetical protein
VEDGTSSRETTHDLLLALAGRVDDDLLAQARELAAIGEDARAVELVTASLVACRAVLPEPVRSAVVAAARSARTDLDPAADLPPPHAGDGIDHRFAVPSDDDPVAAALVALQSRALAGCTVLLTRRRTPAGSSPGPVPHPVVLVQAPAERPAEVLAYQVAVALERRDVRASVEVLPAGTAPSDYHAAALRHAVAVISADDVPAEPAPRSRPEPQPQPQPQPEPQPEPEPVPGRRRLRETSSLLGPLLDAQALGGPDGEREESEVTEPEVSVPEESVATPESPEPADPEPAPASGPSPVGRSVAWEGAPEEPAAAEPAEPPATRPTPTPAPTLAPAPAPAPAPAKEEQAGRPAPRPVPTPTGRIRRPSVTPISRASVPNPIPLVRRSGPAPIVRPIGPAARPKRETNDDVRNDAVRNDAVEPAPTPDTRPAQEPPAPGRTPRRVDTDTSAFDTLSDTLRDPLNGPLNEPLMAPLLDPTPHETDPPARESRGSRDDAPRRERAEEDWSDDWFSGSWAMASSDVESRSRPQPSREPDPGPDDVEEAEPPLPRPAPRRPARHRYLDEPGAGPEPVAEEPAAPEPEPLPEAPPEPQSAELGLRPESVARLSDADRQLLARLQAELLEGRKPRMPRRPGVGAGGKNGLGAGNNGSHRSDPPDLAG